MKCKSKLSGNVTGSLWVDDTTELKKLRIIVTAEFAVSKSATLPKTLTYVESNIITLGLTYNSVRKGGRGRNKIIPL